MEQHQIRHRNSIEQTLQIAQTLLSQYACDGFTGEELCDFLRLECMLSQHKLELGLLALLAAARGLEMQAAKWANEGDIKTLTIQVAGSKSATSLLAVAKAWRTQAAQSMAEDNPGFVLVSVVELCGSSDVLVNCGVPRAYATQLPAAKRCVCRERCPC